MSTTSLHLRARAALDGLRGELLEQRVEAGHWVGELSPSALSTATAVSAMAAVLIHRRGPAVGQDELRAKICCGIRYLRSQQNQDGGFGDTDRSHSNIATSYLVLAASALADMAVSEALSSTEIERLESYIESEDGIDGLRRRYGTDKTFVVPILTNMAIAGLVSWDSVPRLPFEAAVFPQSMYRWMQMPVVSYAIPALVAIGQTRHYHGRPVFWPWKMVRSASVGRTMRVLRNMQPESGGYLEATPLTSFVVMSLAVTQRGDHQVSKNGLRFLCDSMNEDGSWPIDTNLATWVTSLAIDALSCDPEDDGAWCTESLVGWHQSCQHKDRHPFTGAEPGGWGWSDLSGAVPDSDDTPAAIIAIGRMQRWMSGKQKEVSSVAVGAGAEWLRRLQNRDGGWPTFCRGWGKLPFDRSSNDLTAHAIRALASARKLSGGASSVTAERSAKAFEFLETNQLDDGSWLPLWFGNQDRDDESNPIYGTAKVLLAGNVGLSPESVRRGRAYLVRSQNDDGGWGGGLSISAWLGEKKGITSSVEETALALEALIETEISSENPCERNLGNVSGVLHQKSPIQADHAGKAGDHNAKANTRNANDRVVHAKNRGAGKSSERQAIIRGVEFLLERVDDGGHRVAWPIGFYFAKLWYHERLYPLIFTTSAIGKFLRWAASERDSIEQKFDQRTETDFNTSDD